MVQLTVKQKKIVEGEGKFVVKACPGSGKTIAVAARIAHLSNTKGAADHLAIAALSFTNVACDEIQELLSKKFNVSVPLPRPNFIGTIDSFINNFIFLPFGHLVMDCNQRPELVGEPHNFWKYTIDWKNNKGEKAFYQFFDRFSFEKNDKIITTKSIFDTFLKGNFKNVKHHIKSTKDKFFKDGYATQNDANYIALKVLQKYKLITQNLAKRFSHFIIDEAQDTNDVQMEIIELLEQNGAVEILLIGDPDQAIFEWNNAKPELFEIKYNEWERSKEYELNENRRSSKLICTCASRLLASEVPEAIDVDVKDFSFQPLIVSHNENTDQDKLKKIVSDYLEICSNNNIPITHDNVAVLYRSHSIGEWLGIPKPEKKTTPWKNGFYFVRDIAYGKYLTENGDLEKGYKNLELGYHKYVNNINSHIPKESINNEIVKLGYKNYRDKVFSFIEILPAAHNVQLNDWINNTNSNLLAKGYTKKFIVDVSKSKKDFEGIFGNTQKMADKDYFIGTIHSAKGKTFEAVLLIVSKKPSNASKYSNMLKKNYMEQNSDTDKEELRNIYVAITRPRKILIIAVPEQDSAIWKAKIIPNNA